MLLSEAHGRRVVSTGNAATVGQVSSFVLDPANGRVAALVLRKTSGNGTLLPWSDITAFGVDAVTVADERLIVEEQGELAELNGKAHHILKKQILTTGGQLIGIVRDVDFDPADGRIVDLITDDQPIDGRALIGVGSYAVMVRL